MIPAARLLWLYVNDRFAGTTITAWALRRVLAELKRKNANAKSWAVETEPRAAETRTTVPGASYTLPPGYKGER